MYKLNYWNFLNDIIKTVVTFVVNGWLYKLLKPFYNTVAYRVL